MAKYRETGGGVFGGFLAAGLFRRLAAGRGLALLICIGSLSITGVAAAQYDDTDSDTDSTESTTTGLDEDGDDIHEEPAYDMGKDDDDDEEKTSSVEEPDEDSCMPTCEPGFECIKGKCESRCHPACGGSEVCTDSGQCERLGVVGAHMDEAADRRAVYRRDVSLDGIRGFAGLTFGGGIGLNAQDHPVDGLQDPTTSGAMYLAVRGGIFVNVVELMAEYAPNTYLPVAGGPDRRFPQPDWTPDKNDWQQSLTMSVGFHVPVAERVYWPLRIGGGFLANEGEFDFLGRLDVFNVSVKTKHFLFDASFPSIRYMSNFENYHRWNALFTLGASYISP
jgi:hypothetical protein